jgi:hypothetical protein
MIFIDMAKYIIKESQFKRIKEQFDESNNFITGDPEQETLLVTDFLLRYNIVDPENINVFDNTIEIYGFEGIDFPYFQNNMIKLEIYPSKGDIWINVDTDDNDDDFDMKQREEVHNFIRELNDKYSIFHWAFNGEPI